MGGHGGLNILPQKRWNVYNFDNREKVRQDEEAAAKEEQLKREQSRKRDTDFRVEQLRQARGLASVSASSHQSTAADPAPTPTPEAEPKSKHINLFEGIRIFDPVDVDNKKKIELGDEKRKGGFKRMKKEAEPPKVVLPEDEKYRLGYGVAGKGVKLPWYLEKRPNGDDDVHNNDSQETVVTNSRMIEEDIIQQDKIAHIKDQPVQAATNIALQPNSSYSAASSGVRYETSLFLGSSGNGSRIRKGSNKINHLWHDLLIGLNSGDANVGKKLVGAHHYNKDGTLNYRRE
ncbi:unnamed protein product [Lactuca saligna]|uniref:CBF1-interacting co-repressor CIR N-terminal domain-containing protein n=1 Tax=Lactuca saligna TaxID=75948 RepID=A0AA35YHZ4_LACSI|nr:unnamed protein product [Lactuca saligna]